MSKFKKCLSTITHWKDDKKHLELKTSLYVFAESQSSGTPLFYDFTVWQWNNSNIKIKEVGVHPEDK